MTRLNEKIFNEKFEQLKQGTLSTYSFLGWCKQTICDLELAVKHESDGAQQAIDAMKESDKKRYDIEKECLELREENIQLLFEQDCDVSDTTVFKDLLMDRQRIVVEKFRLQHRLEKLHKAAQTGTDIHCSLMVLADAMNDDYK